MEIQFSEQAKLDATTWVNELFDGAIAQSISDVQLRLNGQTAELTARARLNGVMRPLATLQGRVAVEATNRIKNGANMRSGTAVQIEDGLYEHHTSGGDRVDIRVAIFPSVEGEALAMRLPSKGDGTLPTLASVQLNRLNATRLLHLMSQPNGLTCVAGPVGSGKTTTMHAVIGHLGTPERNVFTVEDPVERVLPGAVQIQVGRQTGLAQVLKGLRRSDLDLLLIGEMRDREQALAALDMGSAGTRVISSIHANDSVAAVQQLMILSGAPPRQIGNQVRGVVSQRLLRVLHAECGAQGCADCDNTGYKGRRAIHEVLIIDDAFTHALVRDEPASTLRKIARSRGMQTLWECADELITQGVTDMREAVSILGPRPKPGDPDYEPPMPAPAL